MSILECASRALNGKEVRSKLRNILIKDWIGQFWITLGHAETRSICTIFTPPADLFSTECKCVFRQEVLDMVRASRMLRAMP